MFEILKHAWDKILHPTKIVYVTVAVGVVVIVAATVALNNKEKGASPTSAPEAGTPEGGEVAFSIPAGVTLPAGVTAKVYDPDEHGYYSVHEGAGTYVAYDSTKGRTLSASVTPDGKVTLPDGICGLNIVSAQEPASLPKTVEVTLYGPDGNPLPGIPPQKVAVKCDKYTLNIKITSSKDPVLPDGIDKATVTANLSVHGPAQYINGVKVKPDAPKIMLDTPLGYVTVRFTTDLGALAPNPANVKTDLAGDASVTISSNDAGIAKVRAIAQGIGDAMINIHFPPKITHVSQVFVPPTSPTNYEIKTIPANPKDLTISWKFLPAPGNNCGSMTGPASGKGLVKNGFFHGPQGQYKDGCPEEWEHASKIQVIVTDKDGQSETKTFSARDFEGQGFVKLP